MLADSVFMAIRTAVFITRHIAIDSLLLRAFSVCGLCWWVVRISLFWIWFLLDILLSFSKWTYGLLLWSTWGLLNLWLFLFIWLIYKLYFIFFLRINAILSILCLPVPFFNFASLFHHSSFIFIRLNKFVNLIFSYYSWLVVILFLAYLFTARCHFWTTSQSFVDSWFLLVVYNV